MTKQELRKHIRTTKRQFSNTQLDELSLCILERLKSHPRFVSADTILLYYSLPDEVCTHTLLAETNGKTILLPRVVDDTGMELCEYNGSHDLRMGAFNILEPSGRRFDNYAAIDLAIVPGMAFDANGHRLGRGKGYYDRLLARLPYIYKIGVCFPFQLVDTVPTEETDIQMDEVIG